MPDGLADVVIVVPTLNEERFIGPLLGQLSTQAPNRVLQILVADGGSSDGTRLVVREHSKRDSRIVLIDNPGKLQARGVNRAVAAADQRAQVVIRVDAHASYPDDYVESLLLALRTRGCDSVVVRLLTVGESCFEMAVATVCNSAFGTGGSAHRVGAVSKYVDHGHHAAFLRSIFESLGGYDSTFATNEDAEFDYRLRQSGGKIWLDSNIVVKYVPRSSLVALSRQYFRYGAGRSANFRKHGSLRVRQIIPPIALLLLVSSTLLSALYPGLLALPVIYAATVVAATCRLWFANGRNPCIAAALGVIPTIHFSWAAGFWCGLLSRQSPGRASSGGGDVDG